LGADACAPLFVTQYQDQNKMKTRLIHTRARLALASALHAGSGLSGQAGKQEYGNTLG
jgi:hypothetical protein